jgi:hypothetical protein
MPEVTAHLGDAGIFVRASDSIRLPSRHHDFLLFGEPGKPRRLLYWLCKAVTIRKNKRRCACNRQAVRAETAVFAVLGVAGLAAVVAAVLSGMVTTAPGEDSVAQIPGVNYFGSDQIAADLRTANAVLRYFFESEPATTNLNDLSLKQRGLALPTNTATGKPRA